MLTQAEIEASVRAKCPIIFGVAESVERASFVQKFNAFVDYAAAAAAPVLRAETLRYQSMLLYSSLVLFSISVFKFATIKINDNTITVDAKLILFYGLFVAVVAVIFLVKAYADYKYASLTGIKNSHSIGEVTSLFEIATLKRQIERYFWLELFDAIGLAYGPYADAMDKLSHDDASAPWSQFAPTKTNFFELDREAMIKVPELAIKIADHEKHALELRTELAKDVARFRTRAEAALNAHSTAEDKRYVPFEGTSAKVHAAYDECLRSWFDARNKLADEFFAASFDNLEYSQDNKRLENIQSVLKLIINLRRAYVALEILAPVAFAGASILYVAF